MLLRTKDHATKRENLRDPRPQTTMDFRHAGLRDVGLFLEVESCIAFRTAAPFISASPCLSIGLHRRFMSGDFAYSRIAPRKQRLAAIEAQARLRGPDAVDVVLGVLCDEKELQSIRAAAAIWLCRIARDHPRVSETCRLSIFTDVVDCYEASARAMNMRTIIERHVASWIEPRYADRYVELRSLGVAAIALQQKLRREPRHSTKSTGRSPTTTWFLGAGACADIVTT